MRPHDDITTPDAADPYEVIYHLRESKDRWQQTAETLAKQRDAATALAEEYRVALTEIRDQEWVENTLDPQWAARIAGAALEHRVPDGASQVTRP